MVVVAATPCCIILGAQYIGVIIGVVLIVVVVVPVVEVVVQ